MLKKSVYNSVKSSKPFHFGDIFVYAIVSFVIIALFSFFVFFKKNNEHKGFEVIVKGQTLLTFTFSGNQIKVSNEDLIFVEESDGGVYVTVYQDQEKQSYNVIYFNVNEKTAEVTESTCSLSKDCTVTPAINKSGAIYCAPHSLKIIPIGTEGFIPPTVG